jgi:HSP20 family protein
MISMAGTVHREHRGSLLLDTFGWPWSDEGRMLTQRLLGLGEGLVRVEEFTVAGTYVIRAEIPGIDPGRDVEIIVAGGMLCVRAERREEKKEKADGGFRSEFRYGSFYRTVPLPAGAKEDAVTASYSDGILEIRVPVETGHPKTSVRTVKVERG